MKSGRRSIKLAGCVTTSAGGALHSIRPASSPRRPAVLALATGPEVPGVWRPRPGRGLESWSRALSGFADQLVNERQLHHDFVGDHFGHEVLEAHRAVDFVEEHAELLIGLGERFDGERFADRRRGRASGGASSRALPTCRDRSPRFRRSLPRGGRWRRRSHSGPASRGRRRSCNGSAALRRKPGCGSRRRRRCTPSSHLPSMSVIQ